MIGGKFERILVAFGLIMAITLVAGIPADQAKAAFAGGTGTVGDPFQINDCAQLAEIDDTTSNLSKAYVLTANISCSGSFSPLVNGSTYFSGTLNGAGYQISGLSISCSTAYCGLFARVTTNATFQNLSIQNPSITSTAGCVGALFGYGIGFTSTNVDVVGGTVSGGSSTSPCIGSNVGGLAGSVANGTVTGSDVSATVSGTNDQVGGVIGWSYVSSGACTSGSAKLANSTFSGTVTGLSSVGGLVGEFYRASSDGSCGIFDSSNTGSVTSNGTPCSNFGGVAGSMQGGVVSNVSNTATISASSCPSTGGVIGQLRGMDADDNTSLTRAWNSGLVQGRWYIGGVVGYCDASYATISRSFNIGSISTTSGQVGGVVGVSSCIVSDSFSRASISSTSASWMGGAFGEGISSAIGTESTRVYSASSSYGFLGQNSGGFVCVASFWDSSLKSTTPASCGAGLVGKSTADMKTRATFTAAGWDFEGESANGTNDYWAIDANYNQGYPFLVGVGVSALASSTDTTSPTATVTSPSSPASSQTVTYTFNFSEVISDLTSSDFSNAASSGAASCTYEPSQLAGSTIVVTATCSIGGDLDLRLASNSVQDLAGNYGPGTPVDATRVIVPADITAPSAPNKPDLAAASDSGSSTSDDITNDNTPTISVTAAENGGTVTVTATKSGSSNVTCTMTGSTSGGTCDLGTLANGTWNITATHTDASGNTSANSTALTITIDTTAPTWLSISPTDNSTGVSITTSPTITFVEDVFASTGSVTIRSGSTCSGTFVTIAASNAQINISGSTVTINPTSDFAANTKYCITYAVSTFVDSSGNQVAALSLSSGDSAFSFTTGAADSTPPSAPGLPDLATASDSGLSSSDDITNDNTPTISVTAAENGGTVTVTAVKSGSSNVTCTITGSTSGGTCDLGTLANGTWSITAAHADTAGNTSSNSTTLSITIDTTAPTRSSSSPSAGATGIAISTSPTITFDENIIAGSGNITIYSGASCSTTFATIAGNNAQVAISGTTATINPTADFDHSTQYCITYAATTFTDTSGNQVSALSSTATISFTTASAPATTTTSTTTTTTTAPATTTTTTIAVAASTTSSAAPTSTTPSAPAFPAATTTTTSPLTIRTLSISGAAARYIVTQDGPGLTAVSSSGGGSITWSSLTPGVCSVSTIAMMSILSAQSSIQVGRLDVVGTCTISAVVSATATHASVTTSVSFAVTRIRPVVTVATFENQHFLAKLTLPEEVASSTSLLRSMYGELRFTVTTPETCSIDIISTFDESVNEFGPGGTGIHGRPQFLDSGTCSVRAELANGDRWLRSFSITGASLNGGIGAGSTSTTVASPTTTVPSGSSTTIAGSDGGSGSTVAPGITSFGPTSTATPSVPVIELDVERQIVIDENTAEVVFSRESLVLTANNVGVSVGKIRLRTVSTSWVETEIPDARDVRLAVKRTDTQLNIEVIPESGEIVTIAVPIVISIENGAQWRNFTIAFVLGAGLMAWWLLVWRRRQRRDDPTSPNNMTA